MKKLIILALLVITPFLTFAGEQVYHGSHSIEQSRKNKLLIDAFDTANLSLKAPTGWVKIHEAWIEKATIAGEFPGTWKIVDGYRIVIRAENAKDIGFIVWPGAKTSFAWHGDINPKFRRFQYMRRSEKVPEGPIVLNQQADGKSVLHTIVLKKKKEADRQPDPTRMGACPAI